MVATRPSRELSRNTSHLKSGILASGCSSVFAQPAFVGGVNMHLETGKKKKVFPEGLGRQACFHEVSKGVSPRACCNGPGACSSPTVHMRYPAASVLGVGTTAIPAIAHPTACSLCSHPQCLRSHCHVLRHVLLQGREAGRPPRCPASPPCPMVGLPWGHHLAREGSSPHWRGAVGSPGAGRAWPVCAA